MTSKKIALVYDAIYPHIKGGAEKRYYEVARRLAAKGYDVHLYGMKLWDGDNVVTTEGVHLHGICKAKPIYTSSGRRSIWQAMYFGVHCLKLVREDFDVIDCCGFPYFSLFTCKLVSLVKRKKLHSTWLEVWGKDYWREYLGKPGRVASVVERLSAGMPDEIISISELTTAKLVKELKVTKPIHTIPIGIDFDQVQRVEESEMKSDVIYAGRLMDFKNIDMLIRAISFVKMTRPDIRCRIVGDGPAKESLVSLAERLNLQSNVDFVEFRETSEEVYALMKASRVFVLPSMREGFGIVVPEANACGIPVITVDYKDNATTTLIEEGRNGFVCQCNEQALAGAISNVLDQGLAEKLRDACIASAQRFDWEKIIGEIEAVYGI